ncbi:MAG: shikimate dehydrogenase [Ruminococcaceae bacterium]|jgi:shikimate dehydrogenase|nr:shikimate dehydrogenase [Oscillospiraceae bacterium]
MKYACIAPKLGHSFSALIHAMIGDYDYILREVPEDELDAFMRARDFKGLNVTIPYKERVLSYLDEISDTAAAIGAINTVVNRDGRLYGYNTDFGGLSALIRRIGVDLRGKKVLVLGTGGTSKTARTVARSLGAAEIIVVSRSEKSGSVTYAEARRSHTDAAYIINATPCGMFPDLDGCPIDLSYFPALQGVADPVYNPLSSRLVLAARRRGIPAQGGLYMLVAQAVMAATLFTGKTYPVETTDRIYDTLLRSKRNIVLIGMPGSGKSTVGRLAAERLERPFVDLDEEIVRHTGRPITDIFARDGEVAFRDLESAAVREAAGRTGLVIATGGGCVLRPENVELLRLNGSLVFLDRPLEHLLPTADRPLSDSNDKLRSLYARRRPIYLSAADAVIPVTEDISAVADSVISCCAKE